MISEGKITETVDNSTLQTPHFTMWQERNLFYVATKSDYFNHSRVCATMTTTINIRLVSDAKWLVWKMNWKRFAKHLQSGKLLLQPNLLHIFSQTLQAKTSEIMPKASSCHVDVPMRGWNAAPCRLYTVSWRSASVLCASTVTRIYITN